jgi:hypothetical protein
MPELNRRTPDGAKTSKTAFIYYLKEMGDFQGHTCAHDDAKNDPQGTMVPKYKWV